MKRPTTTLERLLTVSEIAERLSLSEKSVYRLIKGQKLDAIQCGRSLRVHPNDLENFINDHRV